MYKNLIYNGEEYESFQINELGEIKNLKTGNILKANINSQGYKCVSLSMGQRGKVKIIRVHKALAETFIPNPNNLPYVDHIDENKLNNNIDNLQWITPKDNINKHWKSIDTDYYCNRKLTDRDIKIIRNVGMDIPNKELAKIFNVSKVTISNVKNHIYYNY